MHAVVRRGNRFTVDFRHPLCDHRVIEMIARVVAARLRIRQLQPAGERRVDPLRNGIGTRRRQDQILREPCHRFGQTAHGRHEHRRSRRKRLHRNQAESFQRHRGHHAQIRRAIERRKMSVGHETKELYVIGKTRIVDIGDADIVHTDTIGSHRAIEHGVRKILSAKAIPVVLGGDHSINIPCINAFDDQGPIHIIQFDAHLDFVDERHGVRYGHGNPMRRAAEKSYVTGLTQLGIRNVSSTAREGYDDARRMGSEILSVRQIRKLGTEAVLARIPAGKRYYVTIDIDGFAPSIAPGTGTPSHGGFTYYEVLELLEGIVQRGTIVGVDLVEVAPDYDHTGSTAILAAQILLNLLGRMLHRS